MGETRFSNNLSLPRHSYHSLDGLRGVAAIAVAILHMPRVFGGFEVPNAHLAVDFFLQLSGFIVAFAYAERISRGMRFPDFARRRFNRLYPAYFLGFVLGLVVAVAALLFGGSGLSVDWTPGALLCSAIPNAVMLPQAFCGSSELLFPLNPPMWSIFYELIINFIFFVVAVWIVVWKRSLAIALIAFVGLLVLTWGGTLDVGYSWSTFLPGLVRMGFSFLVGVTIYGLKIRPRGTSTLISFALLVVLGAVLLFQQSSYLYEIAMVAVVFPLIIVLGAMYNPTHRGVVWVFAQLGAISYVLYVIHKPLYQLMYAAALRVAPGPVEALGAALGVFFLSFLVLVAWLLARFYEPVARRMLDRALSTRRRSAPR